MSNTLVRYLSRLRRWCAEMQDLSLLLLLKAFLRIFPVLLMLKTPVVIPVLVRLLFALPLSLILSQRLGQEYVGAVAPVGIEDALLGLAIGAFISLFFSAAMKASLFFAPVEVHEDNEEGPWRQVMDSFFFIFLMIIFMALKLERSLLEVLAATAFDGQKFLNLDVWSELLTALTWLALKMSSFGFLLVLTQKLFEEIYRRLGGESLRLVFSVCTWLALLMVSPLLIPSFSNFVGRELADFWKAWMGAAL